MSRAKLNFGTDDEMDDELHPVDPEAIRKAASAAGFRSTNPVPAPTPATASAALDIKRRTRRKTTRVHQFNTRLRGETLQAIHAYADAHDVTIADVIEHALEALDREGDNFKLIKR